MDLSHRPWPAPRRPWVMAQRWHDLLFMHWPFPVEMLEPFVPEGLELDTFEGQGWLGIIPFRMSRVRARLLPPIPWLSAFPELNVRTYVRRKNKPGVLFLSLDAMHRIAVATARRMFHLPYFYAHMHCREEEDGWIDYLSHRTHRWAPDANLVARYRPTGDVRVAEPDSLDHFLTERYCLYTLNGRWRPVRCEIAHEPWPLQPAEVEIRRNSMAHAHGLALPQGAPPHVRFVKRLDVIIWSPDKVERRG